MHSHTCSYTHALSWHKWSNYIFSCTSTTLTTFWWNALTHPPPTCTHAAHAYTHTHTISLSLSLLLITSSKCFPSLCFTYAFALASNTPMHTFTLARTLSTSHKTHFSQNSEAIWIRPSINQSCESSSNQSQRQKINRSYFAFINFFWKFDLARGFSKIVKMN